MGANTRDANSLGGLFSRHRTRRNSPLVKRSTDAAGVAIVADLLFEKADNFIAASGAIKLSATASDTHTTVKTTTATQHSSARITVTSSKVISYNSAVNVAPKVVGVSGGLKSFSNIVSASPRTVVSSVQVILQVTSATLRLSSRTVTANTSIRVGAENVKASARITCVTPKIHTNVGSVTASARIAASVIAIRIGAESVRASAQVAQVNAKQASGAGSTSSSATIAAETSVILAGAGSVTASTKTICASAKLAGVAYGASALRSFSRTTYDTRVDTVITAPSGIQNGDILTVAFVVGRASPGLPSLTWPSGFTEKAGSSQSVSQGGYYVYVVLAEKVANNESGNYTVSHSIERTQAVMLCVSGGTESAFTYASGIGQTSTAQAITTLRNNALIAFLDHGWDWYGNASPPSGTTPTYTEQLDATDTLWYLATGVMETAGSTGADSHTNANQNIGSPWEAYLLAYEPSTVTAAVKVSASAGGSSSSEVISGAANTQGSSSLAASAVAVSTKQVSYAAAVSLSGKISSNVSLVASSSAVVRTGASCASASVAVRQSSLVVSASLQLSSQYDSVKVSTLKVSVSSALDTTYTKLGAAVVARIFWVQFDTLAGNFVQTLGRIYASSSAQETGYRIAGSAVSFSVTSQITETFAKIVSTSAVQKAGISVVGIGAFLPPDVVATSAAARISTNCVATSVKVALSDVDAVASISSLSSAARTATVAVSSVAASYGAVTFSKHTSTQVVQYVGITVRGVAVFLAPNVIYTQPVLRLAPRCLSTFIKIATSVDAVRISAQANDVTAKTLGYSSVGRSSLRMSEGSGKVAAGAGTVKVSYRIVTAATNTVSGVKATFAAVLVAARVVSTQAKRSATTGLIRTNSVLSALVQKQVSHASSVKFSTNVIDVSAKAARSSNSVSGGFGLTNTHRKFGVSNDTGTIGVFGSGVTAKSVTSLGVIGTSAFFQNSGFSFIIPPDSITRTVHRVITVSTPFIFDLTVADRVSKIVSVRPTLVSTVTVNPIKEKEIHVPDVYNVTVIP